MLTYLLMGFVFTAICMIINKVYLGIHYSSVAEVALTLLLGSFLYPLQCVIGGFILAYSALQLNHRQATFDVVLNNQEK